MPWGISESAYAFTDRAGQLSVPRVRRARARAQARPGRRARHRAVRDRARRARQPGGRRGELRAARSAKGCWAASGSTRRSIAGRSRPRREERRRPRLCVRSWCARSSRTTRACRSSRWPTSSVTTCSSTAFTPTRACRPPSCCCRSACRAKRSCRSHGRPRARRRSPAIPVFASRRFKSPHTTSAAHAVPVERPLHGRADAHRRRLQHVARSVGHPAPRRSHGGRRLALHLPARSMVRPRLVTDLSAGRARSRSTSRRSSSSTR